MPLDLSKFDLDKLKLDVSRTLADGVGDLLEGSREDMEAFGAAIADDMLEAYLTGREDLTEILEAQLKVVAEINRVRAENHTWTVVTKVTRAILEAAVAGALAAIF